ncbi:3-keto-5-aminohexanoate cleavage protein [Bosea sp. F3-2]|uniref:3-keto-5-aminohexanoate cleavage protein n=1 Tax=Bosea sp. F3-2 TaxID=2599640 RepID=UPI0032C1BE8C
MIGLGKNATILTCAVTGNLTRPDQHPGLPITPQQIADACIEAGEAGAAVVHIHVRNPETGAPSMDIGLYQDVVNRIREASPRLIINLTTGPGSRFTPSSEDIRVAGPGTTLTTPEKRVEHVGAIRPEICTLDLNTMFSFGSIVMNTPPTVRAMAAEIRKFGVLPELELFDTGDIQLANDLIADGTLDRKPLVQLVMGVKYGAPATPDALATMVRMLPTESIWAAFGIGRMSFPFVALSLLHGGHVRVGLEDNIYISKGVLAESNAQLVRKARQIVESLGARLASSEEARDILQIGR